MPKVSIILPVYNVEKYIDRCMKSILTQSFTDFELIIINDGSKDNSGKICEQYVKKDKRIKLIHQENQGLSMARNKGIENSICEYITFIDSDDYIHRDTIKTLYGNLIANKADISICNYRPVYGIGKVEDENQKNNIELLNNIESVNKILDENSTKLIVAWGKLYKKSLFKEIRYPKGKYHEDEFVTYKLLYKAQKVVITQDKLYYYTQRDKSITGNKYSLKRLEKLEGLKEAINFFEIRDEIELEIKARTRYLLNIQIGYYKVKYEIENQDEIMGKLKDEYNSLYKNLLSTKSKLPLFKRFNLRFFYLFPNLYCRIVKIFIKVRKVLP